MRGAAGLKGERGGGTGTWATLGGRRGKGGTRGSGKAVGGGG